MKALVAEGKDLQGMHDITQSSQITGITHWGLRRLVRQGRLSYIRVGRQGRLMFPAAELLRLLEARKNNK